MAGGRPRAFDPDAALDRALELFWRQGYEGTSLADLTAAMGINRPSLYAAFGNKEELYARALDRYRAGPGGFAAAALAAGTAREVVERLLSGAVELTCGPDTPTGCLSVRGVQACGPEGEPARRVAIGRRAEDAAMLRERLARASSEGDLPPDCDPDALSRLVTALTDGIAVQAAAGASRAELTTIVTAALRAWPD